MKKFYVALSSNSLYEKSIVDNLCEGMPIHLFTGLLVYTKLMVAILNIHNLAYTKDTTLYELEIKDQCLVTTPNSYCYLTYAASKIKALNSDDVINILADESDEQEYPESALKIIRTNLELTSEYNFYYDALTEALNPNSYAHGLYYLKRGEDILNPIVTEGVTPINQQDPELTMLPATCNLIEALYASSIYGSDCKILNVYPGTYNIGNYGHSDVKYNIFSIPNDLKCIKDSYEVPSERITSSINELQPYLSLCMLDLVYLYVIQSRQEENYKSVRDKMIEWGEYLTEHNLGPDGTIEDVARKYYSDILAHLTCDRIEERSLETHYSVDELLSSDKEFLDVPEHIILGTKMLTEEKDDYIVFTLIPKDITNIKPRNIGFRCKDFYKAILSHVRVYDALNFHAFFTALEFELNPITGMSIEDIERIKTTRYCYNVLSVLK